MIVTCFERDQLSPLVPDPAVIVGGTNLLSEFMAHVEHSGQSGRLGIAVPFISPNFIKQARVWGETLAPRVACSIVTGLSPKTEKACRAFLELPWSSLEMWQSPNLHAKTYAFIGSHGFAVALIGSHNLTLAGSSHNDEAGVLLLSRAKTQVSLAIEYCFEHIKNLGRRGTQVYDSTTWPEGALSSRTTV